MLIEKLQAEALKKVEALRTAINAGNYTNAKEITKDLFDALNLLELESLYSPDDDEPFYNK